MRDSPRRPLVKKKQEVGNFCKVCIACRRNKKFKEAFSLPDVLWKMTTGLIFEKLLLFEKFVPDDSSLASSSASSWKKLAKVSSTVIFDDKICSAPTCENFYGLEGKRVQFTSGE